MNNKVALEIGQSATGPMYTLIVIGILIFSSKIVSVLCRRINLPSVVGMILLGIVLGPTVTGVVAPRQMTPETVRERLLEHFPGDQPVQHLSVALPKHMAFEMVHFMSIVGVIILLFLAGLETDLHTFARAGKVSFLVAVGGVILPFGFGFGLSMLFAPGNVNRAMIVGTILTATSVSISVMSLMGIKKLQSPEGTTILTSAIIDDVIGIVILSISLAMISGDRSELARAIFLMSIYLVGAIAIGWFTVPFIMNLSKRMNVPMASNAIALSLMFLFAGTAEYSRIAAITGAYLAGLFIGRTQLKDSVREAMEIIGHSFFIPLFFIYIGLQIDLKEGTYNWAFVFMFVVLAILGKVAGSGILARISGYTTRSSLVVGFGMVPRGEVALVIASLGLQHPEVLDPSVFTATVILVIVTSFITPLVLTKLFEPKVIRHA